MCTWFEFLRTRLIQSYYGRIDRVGVSCHVCSCVVCLCVSMLMWHHARCVLVCINDRIGNPVADSVALEWVLSTAVASRWTIRLVFGTL